MDGEQETRYVKKAVKATPRKANHAHNYIRVVTWMPVRRLDGSESKAKYMFSLTPKCADCGATKRWSRNLNCIEVEVSPQEYNRLKEEA